MRLYCLVNLGFVPLSGSIVQRVQTTILRGKRLGMTGANDVLLSTHDDELAGYEAFNLGVHGGQLRPGVDILLLTEIGIKQIREKLN